MANVLPLETAMLDRLKTLGYAEVSLRADSLWGPAGAVCRGHEYHYSEIVADNSRGCIPAEGETWPPAYTVRRPHGEVVEEGFARGNVLASYIHLHWASRPDVIDHFLAHAEATA
jgi:cobyrinic acid a,c-diamide synthase